MLNDVYIYFDNERLVVSLSSSPSFVGKPTPNEVVVTIDSVVEYRIIGSSESLLSRTSCVSKPVSAKNAAWGHLVPQALLNIWSNLTGVPRGVLIWQ